MEQSEHTSYLLIKLTILYGHQFVAPKNNHNSSIKDHRSWITITNTVIIGQSLKYCKNYQNVIQKHDVSKCC